MLIHDETAPSSSVSARSTNVDAPQQPERTRSGLSWRSSGRRALVLFCQLALLVLFLGAWQVFAGGRGESNTLIDTFYVSEPSAIWTELRSWFGDDVLLSSLRMTLHETIVGFILGAALGAFVGFLLGVNRVLSDILKPFIIGLNTVPRLALVPLYLLWFGLDIQSKIALVVTTVFFLVFAATYEGVRDVQAELVDGLRVMGANRWSVHRVVTVPSAMTWIIAGLKVSVPYALVSAVTAEMISSNRGMGYLIIRSSSEFNTEGIFAAVFVLIVVGVALTGLVTLLERWLLRWKPRSLSKAR